MEKYQVFGTGMYQLGCCRYIKGSMALTKENRKKSREILESLREISPRLLDGKNLTEKIEEIQKNQGFDLNVKLEKGYGIIYAEMQGLDYKTRSIKFAHLELADPIRDKIILFDIDKDCLVIKTRIFDIISLTGCDKGIFNKIKRGLDITYDPYNNELDIYTPTSKIKITQSE